MSNRELLSKVRGLVRRVSIKNIRDDGEAQTASIEVADGIWRDNVEVAQQYGMTSSAPEDGGLAIAIAVGGDEGDMIVLPIGNPSSRLSGLDAGDAALYNQFGDRVVVRAGGGIEVTAANSVALKVGGISLTIDAAGFHFDGGSIWHDGVPIDKTHVHDGVTRGGAKTNPPVSG
ncbi:phage baseplate assembly protein V [Rhizobium skierniewicense]|uniref:Phage baseplate assembly protein V n=1 Tax=Rhizobium skierniewicense TaxID=984260 RepID=A0A7W6G2K6_9HYPH|nr:phage baseplate assembly protein [Rhizobium skierniewicense]MBB3947208.1 phage baseplate assembly protein V [Rhizobium skierniewicense]